MVIESFICSKTLVYSDYSKGFLFLALIHFVYFRVYICNNIIEKSRSKSMSLEKTENNVFSHGQIDALL